MTPVMSAVLYAGVTPKHNGLKLYKIDKKPLSHELVNEWVCQRVNEWVQRSAWAKQAGRSKQMSEWCERKSERMSERPITLHVVPKSFNPSVRRADGRRFLWRVFSLRKSILIAREMSARASGDQCARQPSSCMVQAPVIAARRCSTWANRLKQTQNSHSLIRHRRKLFSFIFEIGPK